MKYTCYESQQKSYTIVYCIIKCIYKAFLNLVNALRDAFEDQWHNATIEPSSVKRNNGTSILTVCTTCTLSLLPDIMKVKKSNTLEREYSKNNEKHQKLITNHISLAPHLAQYTKIGKVSKRFWTAAFTDFDQ